MKLALSANVREWWTRTAAKRERMQPTAQAVGGAPTESQPWRGGRQMSHTCGNILLQLIFSTRERHPLIKPEFRSELFAYLGGIVGEMHGTALIISGTADHVHMLVRTRPARAPAELACVVKTNSSRWVREKSSIYERSRDDYLWTLKISPTRPL